MLATAGQRGCLPMSQDKVPPLVLSFIVWEDAGFNYPKYTGSNYPTSPLIPGILRPWRCRKAREKEFLIKVHESVLCLKRPVWGHHEGVYGLSLSTSGVSDW